MINLSLSEDEAEWLASELDKRRGSHAREIREANPNLTEPQRWALKQLIHHNDPGMHHTVRYALIRRGILRSDGKTLTARGFRVLRHI